MNIIQLFFSSDGDIEKETDVFVILEGLFIWFLNIEMAETGAASALHDQDDEDFQTGDAGASST